jgi:hypothetical protein
MQSGYASRNGLHLALDLGRGGWLGIKWLCLSAIPPTFTRRPDQHDLILGRLERLEKRLDALEKKPHRKSKEPPAKPGGRPAKDAPIP